jgi:hypothetical protein
MNVNDDLKSGQLLRFRLYGKPQDIFVPVSDPTPDVVSHGAVGNAEHSPARTVKDRLDCPGTLKVK